MTFKCKSQSTHPMLYCLGCMSGLFLGIIMLQDVNNSHKIDLLSGRIWRKKLHSSFTKTELATNFHNVTYYRKSRMSLSLSIKKVLDCGRCPLRTRMETERNVWLLKLFSPPTSLDSLDILINAFILRISCMDQLFTITTGTCIKRENRADFDFMLTLRFGIQYICSKVYLSYTVKYMHRIHFKKTTHMLPAPLTVMAFDGIDVNTGVEVSRWEWFSAV